MAWTPGYRRVPPGLTRRVGETLRAAAVTGLHSVRLYANPTIRKPESDVEDDTPIEMGLDYVLHWVIDKKTYSMNLSNMTEAELKALKQVVDLGFSEAMVIASLRDHIASEAEQNGETVFPRSLRGDPKVSIFAGQKREHPQGVPSGHQNDVAGDGSPGDDPSL